MEQLEEKANSYAEERVLDVLKEAFAKVYADGYRDGYKDCEEQNPVVLCDNQPEFVDLGLPSGTLWAADYVEDDDRIAFMPYGETERYQIPTEDSWQELVDNCRWIGDYSNTGQTFYGVTCIGPNGNTIRFSSKGYYEGNVHFGLPYYGGGSVYFWLKDEGNEDENEKKAININLGMNRRPEKIIKRMFTGFELPIRLIRKNE